MALTDINGEDRLVQQTFATHLRDTLGWDSGAVRFAHDVTYCDKPTS